MAKKTKEQMEQKINFGELVAEANVKRFVAEEEELTAKNEEIRALKAKTLHNLSLMKDLQRKAEAVTESQPNYADVLLAERREIRNDVVVDNLRLVSQVLKKYGYYNPDKFQNGCIGLLKAAETFNDEKGVPFHNYAAFCIETEVRLAFRRVNRAFEGKKEGFLDSLDAPNSFGHDGDKVADKHEEIADPYSETEFDAILDESDIDTLFYDIIIPVIETYGKRAKDIDMELWQKLTIQYFIELSMEQSQRQRITFTEMARQLGTTPQNIRVRHKKVMELVKQACIAYGYTFHKSKTGRVRFSREEPNYRTKGSNRNHK